MELTDTRYEVQDGLAWITIDRPDRMNSFRARTVDELIHTIHAHPTMPEAIGEAALDVWHRAIHKA